MRLDAFGVYYGSRAQCVPSGLSAYLIRVADTVISPEKELVAVDNLSNR